MYGKELLIVIGLLVLTALPAVIGLSSSLFKEMPQIQTHLAILFIIYLILFHVGSIWSYQQYSRYGRPRFVWNLYYKIRSKKRRYEIDESLEMEVIEVYQAKLIELAFDDINSNDDARKQMGLISVTEIFFDQNIPIKLKKEIINKLFVSIEHESNKLIKNKLIRHLSHFMKEIGDDELLNL